MWRSPQESSGETSDHTTSKQEEKDQYHDNSWVQQDNQWDVIRPARRHYRCDIDSWELQGEDWGPLDRDSKSKSKEEWPREQTPSESSHKEQVEEHTATESE
ncbi:hypothetical protein EDB87DRAFT_1578757 [Lactarius vividus]|nr:hypothetical protein EDB87DRAFT_1578757 [Lactarius vividus]